MAFGRSNSLSINTGAPTSLFGNNQANPSQPQQSAGLFGAAPASQPQQSGGLFGNTTNNSTQQPQQQSGGLFGNTNPTNTQSTGGGLFGSSATQQSQTQPSGSLFGGALAQPQNQNQPQQQSGGLFGGLGQNNQTQQPGSFSTLKPATNSLFGGGLGQPSNNTQPQQQQQQQSQSLFGSSLLNPTAPTATNPLVGSLTMGQGNNNQQQTVPGTRIDISNLRPTTRFSDLHDDLKKQIEAIDTFIRQQESHCAQCEALLPVHSNNIASLSPDIDLITSKLETVELGLENDTTAIDAAKALVKRDAEDLMRCARVTENLALPTQFHYGPTVAAAARSRSTNASASNTSKNDGSSEGYDVDLVGYFFRQADVMAQTLDLYTSHISEIENHLRVIEVNTTQQTHQLAAQRVGTNAGHGSSAGGLGNQDTIRELADTLRGFEHGILGAAGLVGACREGVNELVLGKLGAGVVDAGRDGTPYARRSVRF